MVDHGSTSWAMVKHDFWPSFVKWHHGQDFAWVVKQRATMLGTTFHDVMMMMMMSIQERNFF